jgi:fumarate reductase subunit D
MRVRVPHCELKWEMSDKMRKSGAKRVVTIMMVIFTILIIGIMQPLYFGVYPYFGLSPIIFIMPISFIGIVCIILHLYQQWPLMLAWFKKSPDRKKQRAKMWRAVVLIALILVLGYHIPSAWYEGLTRTKADILLVLRSMQFGTYLGTVFIIIHVWQRWRLAFSYFRRKPRKKAL